MRLLSILVPLAAAILTLGCQTPAPRRRRVRKKPPAKAPRKDPGSARAEKTKPAPAPAPAPRRAPNEIDRLRVAGEDFVDSYGHVMRFWGMNLVAFYPPHDVADKTAANLAERGFNMARPHHNMRRSKDWNWDMKSGALALYERDSRAPDPEAWDRFDYLNAALRRNGIYLSFALRWSRSYLPEDVDVLDTNDEDRAAWKAAMAELNGWHWRKAIDARKALPMIDDRVCALDVEFARKLLRHVNPYTKTAYGLDPQVATLEIINEYTTEYTFVCNNQLPEYFKNKMNGKWHAYAREHGVGACDFWKPETHGQRQARLAFMRALDEAHFRRISLVARGCGYEGPITFSNLWRGDHMLDMHASTSAHIEDHCYADPFVADTLGDFFYGKSLTMLRGKPYIIGELNQTENAELRKTRGPYRTMMQAAACSYGSFHNWSGMIWFAWQHGGRPVGPDGWAAKPSRAEVGIGDMVRDEMMMDHYRAAGLIYRNGYLRAADGPVTMHVDEPFAYSDYNGLMRGKYRFRPGWQSTLSIRKAFGPAPAGQKDARWMVADAPHPLTSDTGEIVKDTKRKQLSFSAPKAEGFSGMLDGLAPATLRRMSIGNDDGFATVFCVSLDGEDLDASRHILVSATRIGADGAERDDLDLSIAGLARGRWVAITTRPRNRRRETSTIRDSGDGTLRLPGGDWHERELRRD